MAMIKPSDGAKNKRSPKDVPIKKKTFDVIDIAMKNHKIPKLIACVFFPFSPNGSNFQIANANKPNSVRKDTKKPESVKPTGINEEYE